MKGQALTQSTGPCRAEPAAGPGALGQLGFLTYFRLIDPKLEEAFEVSQPAHCSCFTEEENGA